MIPNWTNHLKDQEEKNRFKKYLQSCRTAFERLDAMLEQDISELDGSEADPDQYNSPSWAALQADRNGYRRGLRKVKKLLNLDQKE